MAGKQGQPEQPERPGQPMNAARGGRRRQPADANGLGLPKAMVQDMASLQKPPHGVPQYMDDAIGEAAWDHFEGIRHRRGIRFWGGIGVAAAVAFMLFWAEHAYQPQMYEPGQAPPVAGVHDVDRSGRVDILDALALARYVESGGEYEARWDFNTDGSLDRADVDAAAYSAVSLSKGAS